MQRVAEEVIAMSLHRRYNPKEPATASSVQSRSTAWYNLSVTSNRIQALASLVRGTRDIVLECLHQNTNRVYDPFTFQCAVTEGHMTRVSPTMASRALAECQGYPTSTMSPLKPTSLGRMAMQTHAMKVSQRC